MGFYSPKTKNFFIFFGKWNFLATILKNYRTELFELEK